MEYKKVKLRKNVMSELKIENSFSEKLKILLKIDHDDLTLILELINLPNLLN